MIMIVSPSLFHTKKNTYVHRNSFQLAYSIIRGVCEDTFPVLRVRMVTDYLYAPCIACCCLNDSGRLREYPIRPIQYRICIFQEKRKTNQLSAVSDRNNNNRNNNIFALPVRLYTSRVLTQI